MYTQGCCYTNEIQRNYNVVKVYVCQGAFATICAIENFPGVASDYATQFHCDYATQFHCDSATLHINKLKLPNNISTFSAFSLSHS